MRKSRYDEHGVSHAITYDDDYVCEVFAVVREIPRVDVNAWRIRLDFQHLSWAKEATCLVCVSKLR